MKENLMLHKIIITITVLFIAGSAIAELLFPSEMLTFVGIPSNQQTDFLLRTTAVALLSLLPSLWSARDEANLPASRNALFGIAAYMFLSSAVDYQAFAQGSSIRCRFPVWRSASYGELGFFGLLLGVLQNNSTLASSLCYNFML
jgi:hypothetical protein